MKPGGNKIGRRTASSTPGAPAVATRCAVPAVGRLSVLATGARFVGCTRSTGERWTPGRPLNGPSPNGSVGSTAVFFFSLARLGWAVFGGTAPPRVFTIAAKRGDCRLGAVPTAITDRPSSSPPHSALLSVSDVSEDVDSRFTGPRPSGPTSGTRYNPATKEVLPYSVCFCF
jgi:hypothetical protein